MSVLNFAELSRSSSIPQSTLKRYMALLETTFLIQTLPAWSSNLSKQLVKSPKLLLSDTGLMAYLLGLNTDRLERETGLIGPLVENFVAMELRKQITWSRSQPQMFHFRTQAGQEVDIVLEDAAGNLVAIEVKASSTLGRHDLKGLQAFAEMTGNRFHRGVILYTGRKSIPFNPMMYALPVSALWSRER